jgi:hypothetical protein
VKAGGFLAGQEDIIDQLKPVDKRFPASTWSSAQRRSAPLDVQLENLDPFAKEVVPAFRDAKIAAAGAIDPRVSRLVPVRRHVRVAVGSDHQQRDRPEHRPLGRMPVPVIRVHRDWSRR